ncbi:MAG: universal stress protein [Bacteroidales bacterium]|nr:universal stress protein [Bacteroidales bacterium]
MLPGLMYSILVPVDFTQQSVWALSAAAVFARKNRGLIHLLHIVDERFDPAKDEIEKARVSLFEFAQNYQQELGVTIIPNVETGSVFQSIGETANRLGVKMIVMGTHGIKGIQKVIGSYAIRVILGSKVPVVLIKEPLLSESFKNVVIPFDPAESVDLVTEKVIEWGNPFHNISVCLFSRVRTMSAFRKRIIMGRIKRTLKQITSAGLESKSIIIQNDIQDFKDTLIRYARNINADIIAFPLQVKKSENEYYVSDLALHLCANAPCPLWVVNPQKI